MGGTTTSPEFPEEPDRPARKAKVFLDRGNVLMGTGNYDYAIEMYVQAMSLAPDSVDAHRALREVALTRKARGGRDMGMFEKMKLKRATGDDTLDMLNAEKMLAYDPANTDLMLAILHAAQRAGHRNTVSWIGPILRKASGDDRGSFE